MIAAAGSGSGKTLFTCGLLSYLKKNNRKVYSYKCGPDYIDPMFHRNVLGISGGNLDSYFCDEKTINDILAHFDENGDVAWNATEPVNDGNATKCVVIEGVMGIYDGLAGIELRGSSYDIATITQTPIILILDCHGSSRTVISLLKGILMDDNEKLIKGVVFNQIPQNLYESLYPLVAQMIDEEGFDTKLLGYIPKLKNVHLESRHLGLIMPDEIDNLVEQVDEVADAIATGIDIHNLLTIMDEACDIAYSAPADRGAYDSKELTIAVARDEAFCFYYKENLLEFEKRGIKLIPFSPIHDKKLPENIQGILLGGGYPELYLKKLSDNTSMLKSIRNAINQGMPSIAECGGFMYLHDTVMDEDGEKYHLAGVIDGECCRKDRLVRFGYIELHHNEQGAVDNTFIDGVRGHEFHYYDSSANGSSAIAQKPVTAKSWTCMHIGENNIWGFPHLYYPSSQSLIDWFVNKMKNYLI